MNFLDNSLLPENQILVIQVAPSGPPRTPSASDDIPVTPHRQTTP